MATDGAKRRAFRLESGDLQAAFLFVDGALDDLFVERETANETALPRSGEIYWARVDRVMDGGRTGRRAAFLKAGGGVSLYLPDSDGLSPGDRILVEITREPEGDKAARAGRRLSFAGALMVHTLGAPGVNVSRKIADKAVRETLAEAVRPFAEHGGFVIRTRAASATPADLSREAERLAQNAAALRATPPEPPRCIRRAPGPAERAEATWGLPLGDLATEPGLARRALEAVEALGETRISLAGAGNAWVALEQTEALVSVDVNTGDGAAPLAANLAALQILPRQLRLRGWGGIVVIDLAPFADGDRQRLQKALVSAADNALDVAGYGPLGLLEAVRRKDRPPLAPAGDALRRALAAIAEDPAAHG